jgi:hypothetical protein
LTTIGIVIGVASVTAVIAALTGLRSNVLDEFQSLGANKIFINPDIGGSRNMSYARYVFKNEEIEGCSTTARRCRDSPASCPAAWRRSRTGTRPNRTSP